MNEQRLETKSINIKWLKPFDRENHSELNAYASIFLSFIRFIDVNGEKFLIRWIFFYSWLRLCLLKSLIHIYLYSHFTGTQIPRKISLLRCLRTNQEHRKRKKKFSIFWFELTTIHAHLHIFTAVHFLFFSDICRMCTICLCISVRCFFSLS